MDKTVKRVEVNYVAALDHVAKLVLTFADCFFLESMLVKTPYSKLSFLLDVVF